MVDMAGDMADMGVAMGVVMDVMVAAVTGDTGVTATDDKYGNGLLSGS